MGLDLSFSIKRPRPWCSKVLDKLVLLTTCPILFLNELLKIRWYFNAFSLEPLSLTRVSIGSCLIYQVTDVDRIQSRKDLYHYKLHFLRYTWSLMKDSRRPRNLGSTVLPWDHLKPKHFVNLIILPKAKFAWPTTKPMMRRGTKCLNLPLGILAR